MDITFEDQLIQQGQHELFQSTLRFLGDPGAPTLGFNKKLDEIWKISLFFSQSFDRLIFFRNFNPQEAYGFLY